MRHPHLQTLILSFTAAVFSGCPSAPDAVIDAQNGTDAGGTLSCELYCDTTLAACGAIDVSGLDAKSSQYLSKAGCLKQCASMPLGARSDRSVDSVGCRLHEATAALESPSPARCAAAGPSGGAVCGADRCQAFCRQALSRCAVLAEANGGQSIESFT